MGLSISSSELKKKAKFIFKLLDAHYPKEIVFLEFKNPFQTLISVILSAQTTDRQVNAIQPALFSAYPDAKALSHATQTDVEEIIKPVGFFKTKAKNIIATATILEERYNGEVPSTIEELIRLPGCGRKSANVVVGHCFNQPAIIVDTHFGRVMLRLGLSDSKKPAVVETDIASLIEPKNRYRFSMSANLHGRKICHARTPECQECFLAKQCLFFSKQE